MSCIGIYGGSFNPIHLGHTRLAHNLCKAGLVDRVWLLVSPLNPLKKDDADTIIPTEIRLRMARIAVEKVKSVEVSDFETKMPVPSYTVNTMKAIAAEFPQHEFRIVIGQDNWAHFGQWYKADEIRAMYDIIVYGRNQDGKAADKRAKVVLYKKNGEIIDFSNSYHFPLYNISATKIRQAVKSSNFNFAKRWLNPNVLELINQLNLFKPNTPANSLPLCRFL